MPGVVVCAYNLDTWEAKAGHLEVRGGRGQNLSGLNFHCEMNMDQC